MEEPAYLLFLKGQGMVLVHPSHELSQSGSVSLLQPLFDPLDPNPVDTTLLPP